MIHLMLSQRLFISLLFILPCLVAAAKSTCSFSCPPTDKLSQSLVKRPHAVGFDSFYSIFECMWVTNGVIYFSKFWPIHWIRYLSSNPDLPDPTCSYYKVCGRFVTLYFFNSYILLAFPRILVFKLSDQYTTIVCPSLSPVLRQTRNIHSQNRPCSQARTRTRYLHGSRLVVIICTWRSITNS